MTVIMLFHLLLEHIRIACHSGIDWIRNNSHIWKFALALKTKLDEYRTLVNCSEMQVAVLLDHQVELYLIQVGIDSEKGKSFFREE